MTAAGGGGGMRRRRRADGACASLVLLLLLLSLAASANGRTSTLFDERTDQVILLNGTTFGKYVNGSDVSSAVLFYSSFCGHCQRFAPHFASLAVALQDCRDRVALAAIDCVNSDNRDACNAHNIHGYPTTMMFHPHNRKSPDTLDKLQTDTELSHMMYKVASSLPFPVPPIQEASFVERFFHEENNQSSTLSVLFFKEGDLEEARRLVYNLALLSTPFPRLVTVGVEADGLTNVELGSEVDVSVLPVLYTVRLKRGEGETNTIFYKLVHSRSYNAEEYVEQLKRLHTYLPGPGLATVRINAGISSGGGADTRTRDQASQTFIFAHRDPGVVYTEDLLSTVKFALTEEVPAFFPLHANNTRPLQRFLHTLAKYFPAAGGDARSREWALRVRGWCAQLRPLATPGNETSYSDTAKRLFQRIVTGASMLPLVAGDSEHVACGGHGDMEPCMEGEQLHDNAPMRVSWVNCLGSEDRFRGYPCGLWTLFHTLQVSAYEADVTDISLVDVMHGFVTQFFSCINCRNNFNKETATYTQHTNTARQGMLYLWRVHNSVNARLHGDITEDPTHIKVQFPDENTCPACRAHGPDAKASEIVWNENAVFTFLRSTYGASNIRLFDPGYSQPTGDDTGLALQRLEKAQLTTGGLFSSSDVFLMGGVYLFSLISIVLAYYFFVRRRPLCRTRSPSPFYHPMTSGGQHA